MVKRDSEKKTYIVGEGEHDDIWLSHIPVYVCTTFCLSVSLLMDIWVVPAFGCCEQGNHEYQCTRVYQPGFQFFEVFM